jgi:hypothetical protein
MYKIEILPVLLFGGYMYMYNNNIKEECKEPG